MEQEGTRRVEIAGKDDKRQITAVLACTMSGDLLPLQLVCQGKYHVVSLRLNFKLSGILLTLKTVGVIKLL